MDRCRAWLIDGRGLAQKIINASLPAEDQINDCGATRQCPNCLNTIDNSDVGKWPGFPTGVKFDPSDVDLLHHLASKRGEGSSEPHVYIDYFIKSLEDDEGICYSHPEYLPGELDDLDSEKGAKRDGSCVHFFHRIKKAYASGQRKRRRIQGQENTSIGPVRWHKTGKTKPVMENGVQKGFKKIMVLYANSKRGCKPEKCNWVMHQYHLGTDEEENDGEFVVSKIFYHPQKETEKTEACLVVPTTPGTDAYSDLTQLEKTPSSDCISDYHLFMQPIVEDPSHNLYDSQLEEEIEYAWLKWGPEANGLTIQDNTFSCNETACSLDDDDLKQRVSTFAQVGVEESGVHDALSCKEMASLDDDDDLRRRVSENNKSCGIVELDDLVLDTPPDFDANDLTFGSQDSVFDILDLL